MIWKQMLKAVQAMHDQRVSSRAMRCVGKAWEPRLRQYSKRSMFVQNSNNWIDLCADTSPRKCQATAVLSKAS